MLVLLLLAACAEGPDVASGNAVEKAECDARGGLWTHFPDLYPDKSRLSVDDLKRFVCRMPVQAAGKACSDRADCGGADCLAPAGARSGAKATGTCVAYDWTPRGPLLVFEGRVTYPETTTEMFPRKAAMLEELRRNEEKWRGREIKSYRVTIEEHACFCLYGPYYGPNQLTVKNGKLVSAIYHGERRDGFRSGDQLLNQDALKDTIEEMFDRLETLIANFTDNADIEVEYDRTYGFPTRIAFDRPDWEDVQWDTRFTEFVPL